MDTRIKVSVIVPVYKAERYLSRCVESILNQSLIDIEVILVDDGSPDQSGRICDGYAQKDNRVKVLHIANGGPANARNKGIEIAVGEYIGFVDSDDYIAPDMYDRLYSTAAEYDSDIVMCGYSVVVGEKKNQVKMDHYRSHYLNNREIRQNLLQLYYTGEIQGLYSLCIKVYKKTLIQENRLRMDVKLRRGEDAWFNFDALKLANSFSFINEPLYYYVQDSESIMHTIQTKQYEHWVENKKRLLTENETLNFKIDNKKFYHSFLYKVAVHCRELVQIGEMQEVRAILNDNFLKNASSYSSGLPIHIKFIYFTNKLSSELAIRIIKLWRNTNGQKQ